MKRRTVDAQVISKLFFRLLPVQILLCAVGAVNGIVSSLFASNSVGAVAMSAIGLYAPVNQLLGAVSTMLVGGSQILCGKYMGRNQVERTQGIFSLDILISLAVSLLAVVSLVITAGLGFVGASARDPEVSAVFSRYLLGQSIGVLPMILGQQLSAFLSLEHRSGRTCAASIAFIITNILMNFLFVQVLRMEAFGLALASSVGLWVFFAVQAQYYVSGKSLLRLRVRGLRWREAGDIVKIGIPGAISSGYQTIRRVLVNNLIVLFVGSIGLSAFAASDALLGIIWAIPGGIVAVSRMLMSVSVGEEDRQTLKDVMRTALYRCVPLMCGISALLILFAVPLTRLYYRDAADPVYHMTVMGFRILPLCMPLSVICMHFVCYGQTSGKQVLVHLLSVLDGVVCVAGFSALLVPRMGINGVYVANVLNGLVTTLVIVLYAWICGKRFPRDMDSLMVIPENFGAPEDARMDLTLRSVEEVVDVSRQVQDFCLRRGIDGRRSYLAGLFMEEMAGNVIEHGFTKDRKKHAVDIRVVHKDGAVILRIKDDCVPFNPQERQKIVDPADPAKNIGIRMVYRIADDIKYQNILGLNVLTIRI